MAAPQSDQFNSGELSAFWTFVEPDPASDFNLTGSALELTIPGGANHDFWTNNLDAARMEQAVDDVDFDLVVKLDSLPGSDASFGGGFHAVGLYVMTSDDSVSSSGWVRWDVIANDTQNELFCASRASGSSATTELREDVAGTVPLYLRLERDGSSWTVYTSLDGETWTTEATFTFALTVARCGVYIGNSGSGGGSNATSHTKSIDSFVNLDASAGIDEPVNQALTTEQALSITASKSHTLGLAVESSRALPIDSDVVLPDGRTLLVAREPRTLDITEDRTFTVSRESRTLEITT